MAGTAQGDRAGRDASGGPLGSRYNRRDRPVRRHPVRGAVARGGGHPGQSARRDRDRARHRDLRAHREWRSDRNRERVGGDSSRTDHHAGGTAQTARGLLRTPLCRRRRIDLVWGEFRRPIPASSRLRRSHPQGREAGRPAGAGANQVRNGAQPQDRQGARPRRAARSARARRRSDRMKQRREFIALLGGAAAWPLAARAQQPGLPVIGFVDAGSADAAADFVAAFRKGLSETGYVEGQNVTVEHHWLNGQFDRLPAVIADLVRRRVAVIATPGSRPAAIAAKAATTTIPIVFAVGDDPVKLGLVASLARPGGNATGTNFFNAELVAKRLGLLHELVAKAVRIAVLVNPANASIAETTVRDVQEAARVMRLQIQVLNATTVGEIDAAFATLARERPDALFVASDAFFTSRRVQFATLTARERLPAAYPNREYVAAGGLMSYGTDLADMYHQVGLYTGNILKGAKPADLPVVQSTKFELAINLQTARLLGLEVSPSLLAIADEVIE